MFPGIAGAIFVLAISWAITRFLEHFDWLPALSHPVTGNVDTLLGAILAAEATFLALHFATVGVIASTSYRTVPAAVRELFVQNAESAAYTRDVVRVLALSLIVLVLSVSGNAPTTLTIWIVAGLALLSGFVLAKLGAELFNFLDPAALTRSLPLRFANSLQLVSNPSSTIDDVRQRGAQQDVAEILRLYSLVLTLTSGAGAQDYVGARRVSRQLLQMHAQYSRIKHVIPTNNAWWLQTPVHPNWLTLEELQLGVALATSTGVPPTFVSDDMWVERRIARCLQIAAGRMSEASPDEHAKLIDDAAPLLEFLGNQLQASEGILLQRALERTLIVFVRPPDDIEGHLADLASAERSVLSLTYLWLGTVRAARTLADADIKTVFDTAVESYSDRYGSGLPRTTLDTLEDLATAIEREKVVEGKRITPHWFTRHIVGKSLFEHLVKCEGVLLEEADIRLRKQTATALETQQYSIASVTVFAGLELIAKVRTGDEVIDKALDSLDHLRNAPMNESWVRPNVTGKMDELSEYLVRALGACLPHLRVSAHNSSRPDLHGQAHQFLFQTTFDALLAHDDELAVHIFRILLAEVDPARVRLQNDLSKANAESRFIYSIEPLIGIMELSGCALLAGELGGSAWNTIRPLLDVLIVANNDLPKTMATNYDLAKSVFAITQGALGRGGRMQTINTVLRDMGLQDSWPISPYSGSQAATHPSPIVAAMARSTGGLRGDLVELFLASYLIEKDPTIKLRPAAESLRRSILRFSESHQTDHGQSEVDE